MGITKSAVLMAASAITTCAATGAAVYSAVKAKKLEEKLNETTDVVAGGIDIKLPEDILKAAVDKSVDRTVEEYAKSVSADLRSTMSETIKKDVNAVVGMEFEKVRPQVKEQLSKRIGSLNITSIKEDLIEEAKKAAKEKFESDLDKVLEDYSDNLANVSKIYQSIADQMKPARDAGIKITAG